MTNPTVFISYSHKDEVWKVRLVTHLGVQQQEGLIDIWDDRRIGTGEDWYQNIEEAIAKSRVAVLLVSADFLTSKFISNNEIPSLLERMDKEGLRIYPIIIKPCAWEQVGWLKKMNLRPKDGKALSGGSDFEIDTDLTLIAKEIEDIIKNEKKDGGLFIDPGTITEVYTNKKGEKEDIKSEQEVFNKDEGKIILNVFERNNTPRGGQ